MISKSSTAILEGGVGRKREMSFLPCRKTAIRQSAESVRNRGFLRSEATEWWYWMKEKQNDPAIWQEARKLF